MAVKVTYGGTIFEYEKGERVQVSAGHLLVTRWSGEQGIDLTLAVFAPERWTYAEVVE